MKLYELNFYNTPTQILINSAFQQSMLEHSIYFTSDINEADAILMNMRPLNFFGGVIINDIKNELEKIKNFNGQVYLLVVDPELSKNMSIDKFINHIKSKDWDCEHLTNLINNNFAGYITEHNFRINEWSKHIDPKDIKFQVKQGWFAANLIYPEQPASQMKFYDLCYIGSNKATRVKELNEFIIPNTIIGGSISKSVCSDHSILRCGINKAKEIRNQSKATIVVSNKHHNNTYAYQRVAESLLSDAITLVPPDFDTNNTVLTHRMSKYTVVRNKLEILQILYDPILLNDILEAEQEQASMIREYCRININCKT